MSRVKILSFAKKSVYQFKHRLERKQKPSHSLISFSVSTFEVNVWKHVFELVYWLKENRVPNQSDVDKWQLDSKLVVLQKQRNDVKSPGAVLKKFWPLLQLGFY